MRKTFKLGAVAAAAALVLAACSSGGGDKAESGEEKAPEKVDGAGVTLTIWTDENREAAITEAAAEFSEATGATVEVVQKNFDDLRTDFISQVSAGGGPDITVGAHDWLGALVAEGVVNTIDLGDKKNEFEKVTVDAFTYDGQLYGLPYASEAMALVRNTDLVGDEDIKDFEELLAKGNEAGVERPFVVGIGDGGNMYNTYAFQTSFDAPVFVQSADGSYTNEVGMGGENGQKFAEWMAAQGADGVLSTTVDNDIAQELFTSGKAPFALVGPWTISALKDAGMGENIKVSKIPSAGGKEASPFVGVQGFYLSSKSANALLATNFITEYLGSEKTQQALYDSDPRIPAMTKLADKYRDDPIIGGFIESASVGVPMPSIPEMGDVWDLWNNSQVQILGGADPVATWDKMVADLEAAVAG